MPYTNNINHKKARVTILIAEKKYDLKQSFTRNK